MVEEKGRRIKVVIEGFAFEVSAFSLYIDWWEFLNAYFRQGRSDFCVKLCVERFHHWRSQVTTLKMVATMAIRDRQKTS